MSDEPRQDQELLEELTAALEPPRREPPADRVAALRRLVEQAGGAAGPAAGSEPIPLRPRADRTGAGAGRRQILLGGVAASIGAVIGVVAGREIGPDDPSGPPTEEVALAGLPLGVTANARLINHTWGVELLLDIDGLPRRSQFDVVYRGVDGAEVGAGSFLADPSRPMICRFNASLLRPDTTAIELSERDGDIRLRADLT